jgi:hemerythrin-like domain-containing protein
MRYKFYREHKYVSAAFNDLERLIAKTDFINDSEIKTVKKELDALTQMIKGHAHYEEQVLHVLLKKRNSPVVVQIEDDHAYLDGVINDLLERLQKIMIAPNEIDKIELGYQFYLSFRKFVGENLIHLHEEETIILPELQRLYSDEELRTVEFDTYERMTPDQMIHMLNVLFPHMNIHDKEVFLKDIKDSQPEKFASIWLKIQNLLNLEELDYLNRSLYK